MATLQELLENLQNIDITTNDSSLISLLKDISGNPSDDVESSEDPESIHGQIVIMYRALIDAYESGDLVKVSNVSEEISLLANNIDNINSLSEEVETINTITTEIVPNLLEILEADANAAIAAEKALEASASASSASDSANQVSIDLATTNQNVIVTNANVATTNSNAAIINANVITTNSDVETTNANASLTNANAISTNSDKIQTGLDVLATNADVLVTNADVVAANNSSTIASDKASIATTKANEALNSAIAAQESEDNAAESETSAEASASAALGSETNAATSASSALASKNSAEAAQDIAESARDVALTAKNEVLEKYLGGKITDPTTDNEGQALVEGALYYNTALVPKQLKIWNGSSWNTAVFDASDAVTTFNGRDGSVSLSYSDVVTALGFTPTVDQTKEDIDALNIDAGTVNGKTVETSVPTGAVFTDTVYDDSAVLKDTDIGSAVLAPDGDGSQLTGIVPGGLLQVTENSKTGYRLVGVNAAQYSGIGNQAVDLSHPKLPIGTVEGATGYRSFATGVSTEASGASSFVVGEYTTASGDFSFAAGLASEAIGEASFALGERVTANKNNAIVLGKNGGIGSGSSTVFGVVYDDDSPGDISASTTDTNLIFGVTPYGTTVEGIASSTSVSTNYVKEAYVNLGLSREIDVRSGAVFTAALPSSTTFTIADNVPTDGVISFVLQIYSSGSCTVTWWDGIKWADGVAPSLTPSGTDILGFYTYDGGTTWRGVVMALDSK